MLTLNPAMPLTTRRAACRCERLTAICVGEPVRISVCHCLACQRRSGSAFAVQARFPSERVQIDGDRKAFVRTADSGKTATYHFCPDCGSTIAYENEGMEGVIAIPLGAFADPDFPPPAFSVYEERKHAWVAILGSDIAHDW